MTITPEDAELAKTALAICDGDRSRALVMLRNECGWTISHAVTCMRLMREADDNLSDLEWLRGSTKRKGVLTVRISRSGGQFVREQEFSQDVIKIGKTATATLKLDDETVNRMHAIIEFNGLDDVCVIDLGSTTGTYINGQKVNKGKLKSGDILLIGGTWLELTLKEIK